MCLCLFGLEGERLKGVLCAPRRFSVACVEKMACYDSTALDFEIFAVCSQRIVAIL